MATEQLTDLIARYARGGLTRRQVIQRALALGIAAPVVTSALASPGAAAPTNRPGGSKVGSHQMDSRTLVIADNLKDNWLTLDPGWFYEINPAAAMNLVYEPLYTLPDSSKPTEFAPLLADGMPEVSEDGLTATIALRSGVKFHNSGNEMTADDWVFSWNRLKNIKFQGSFMAADYWSAVEAVDPLTLQITLSSPNAALVPILSSMPLSVVDSTTMRENGATDAEDADATDEAREWLNSGVSAGTGPYMLTAWDIEGEVIVEAFADYYGEPPALDRVIWRNVVDPNTQLQLVERGEADIAYSLDPDAAQSVTENEELQLVTGPALAHEYLALNLREDVGGPLANQQVRQAIGYAIDYDGIIETLLAGAAVKPATIVPVPLLGAEEVQGDGYSLDLVRAQELWDESGVGEVELTFSYGAGGQGEGGVDLETLVAKLQSDLQQISGLTVALNPMDPATRLEEYRNGTLQFTISGWSPDYPDVHTYAEPFGRTDTAAAKRVGYSNPEVDQWLDEGIAEADPEARAAIYVDIQRQLIADAAFLVLYQPIDQKAASAAVQGLQTHSVVMMQLRNVSKSA
ncbi:MAG: ABC transporter substrate-binding protein [Chloroflexota bacterium]|nr:ABC transporter substrate-binding protein [Chloroflexota bacterium]